MKTQTRSTLALTPHTPAQRARWNDDAALVLREHGLRVVCLAESKAGPKGLAVDADGCAFECGPYGIAPLTPRQAVKRFARLMCGPSTVHEPFPLVDWLGAVAALLPGKLAA